jgi:hypothetical protein
MLRDSITGLIAEGPAVALLKQNVRLMKDLQFL